MANVYQLMADYPEMWKAAGSEVMPFLDLLMAEDYITQDEYEFLAQQPYKALTTGVDVPTEVARLPSEPGWLMTPVSVPITGEEAALRLKVGDALFDKQKGYFASAFREVLVSLTRWFYEHLKGLIDLVVGAVRPILEQAWELASTKFEELGRTMYDGAMKLFEGHSPIGPDDAPALALKLYLLAWGAGLTAHGIATATELLHPLKRLGVHQAAAAVGDFAGFGRISAATMGTLVNRVLGQLMTYACQNQYRPQIPRESLLIELRSKREIDKAAFDKAMGYQGYNQDWIDVIERWQWKDPRMFEIIRLADVGLEQGPPPAEEMDWLTKFGVTGDRLKDWWLYRKFMRAGYEDVDLDVMVNFIHRREVSFALTYVRTAIRRNYRWGYLTDEELQEWLDRLNLPPKAKEWIFWAGELDREYFYRQDMVSYYKTAYRNDLIDDDEFLVSLVAMSLPAREAEIIVRTEKAKKTPKPTTAAPKEVKAALTDVQKKYITLYRDQYRKNLITDDQYLQSLMAVGLTAQMAEVTVALEQTRKAPALP